MVLEHSLNILQNSNLNFFIKLILDKVLLIKVIVNYKSKFFKIKNFFKNKKSFNLMIKFTYFCGLFMVFLKFFFKFLEYYQ